MSSDEEISDADGESSDDDETSEVEERPAEAMNPPDEGTHKATKASKASLDAAAKEAVKRRFKGGPLGDQLPAPRPPAHDEAKGGPRHRQPKRTPLEWLRLYLTDELLDQVVEQTNNYMRQNPKRVKGTPRDTTRGELRNFFTCLLALSIVDYKAFPLAWQKDDEHGLLGNPFLQSTMSYTRFRTLYRCVNADVIAWTAHFNETNAREWILGQHVCFDDDVDRFKGRPGTEGVKYVPKKEAKRGIASWRIADQHCHCYYLLWEAEFAASGAGPLGPRIMDVFLQQLRHLPHRTIYLDAGVLGSWESTEQLLAAKHSFIISHAANRPAWLFSNLLHRIDVRPEAEHWVSIGNGEVIAVTYAAKKKDRPIKLVNFTTNLCGLTVRSAASNKPAIVEAYNKHKSYVDQVKASFNQYSLRHRCKRLWKHKFFVLFFLAVHNAYTLWRDSSPAREGSTSRTKLAFLKTVIPSLRDEAASRRVAIPGPFLTLVTHTLVKVDRQQRCSVPGCHGRTTFGCAKCNPSVGPVPVCSKPRCWNLLHCRILAKHFPDIYALSESDS